MTAGTSRAARPAGSATCGSTRSSPSRSSSARRSSSSKGRRARSSRRRRRSPSRILAGYAKYHAAEGYDADAANWAEGGLWELRPVKAFAWSVFPDDMTRFRFEVDDPG